MFAHIERTQLRLFNLEKYCREELKNQDSIKIIDLLQHSQLPECEQIIALPTPIKKLPDPVGVWLAICPTK